MHKIIAIVFSIFFITNFAWTQRVLKNQDDNWIQEYQDGSFRALDLRNEVDRNILEVALLADSSYNFLGNKEDNFYFIKTFLLGEKCKAEIAAAKMRYDLAYRDYLLAEDELNLVKQEQSKQELTKIQSKKNSKASVWNASKAELELLTKTQDELSNLLNFSPPKRKRVLQKTYKVQFGNELQVADKQDSSATREGMGSGELENRIEVPPKSIAIAPKYPEPSFSPVDLAQNPPYKWYKVVFDGIDVFTKNQRKELEKDLLFSFTDENLKSFHIARDFIICHANLVRYRGYSVVNMDININSINTANQFGSLERGSFLLLKLVNGENVRLMCNHTDKGKVDPIDGTTTYTSQFVIDRNAENKLEKYEVDKLRLIWSTGFDEFDILNMDFFMNQIRSLN